TGAALVGPALAGLLLRPIGAGWIFAINAASFLFVIGALAGLSKRPPRAAAAPDWDEALFGGWRHVAGQPRLRVLLLLSAVAAICGRSYTQLLPVFADALWHRGSLGYGALLGAGGAGALLGAFGLSSRRALPRHESVLIGAGVAFAVCLG